jgi:hypothetical protein
VSALERRYRRLLLLLPVDERRARGDELVGVLTDLDAGRSWPSRGEAWAVALLALRLRGARSRTLLVLVLTALLVAFGTQPAGNLIDAYTGAMLPADLAMARAHLPIDLAVALVPLAAAVAWILGAVRVATGLHAVILLTFGIVIGGELMGTGPGSGLDPLWILQALSVPVLILVLLVAAWRLRWQPPRPRVMWLLLVPVCVAAWKGIGAWGRHGVTYSPLGDLLGTAAVVLACAGAAAWLARHHRGAVIAQAGLAGAAAGYVLARVLHLPNLLWFAPFGGDPVPFALTLLALGALAHLLARRLFGEREGDVRPG